MFALRSLARRISDYTDIVMRPYGLNAAKYNYLTVLYMAPRQELTLTEISGLIHTSNATVTGMMTLLQRDGLVRRATNRDDARSVVVRLTPKGRKVAETTIPIHQRMTEEALRDLTLDERKTLVDLLVKVGEGYDRQNYHDSASRK
jgi:DNA-binding MarR family transcriptional regulator